MPVAVTLSESTVLSHLNETVFPPCGFKCFAGKRSAAAGPSGVPGTNAHHGQGMSTSDRGVQGGEERVPVHAKSSQAGFEDLDPLIAQHSA